MLRVALGGSVPWLDSGGCGCVCVRLSGLSVLFFSF